MKNEKLLKDMLKKKGMDGGAEELRQEAEYDKAVLRGEILKNQEPNSYGYKTKRTSKFSYGH